MWWIIIGIALVVGLFIYIKSEREIRKQAAQNMIDDFKRENDSEDD